jgi:hypothetical protein
MADWDGIEKAPNGLYRVIGTDTFSWPHEDYWIGGCAGLPEAEKLASSHMGAMNSAAIYDDNGKRLFLVSSTDPKV